MFVRTYALVSKWVIWGFEDAFLKKVGDVGIWFGCVFEDKLLL